MTQWVFWASIYITPTVWGTKARPVAMGSALFMAFSILCSGSANGTLGHDMSPVEGNARIWTRHKPTSLSWCAPVRLYPPSLGSGPWLRLLDWSLWWALIHRGGKALLGGLEMNKTRRAEQEGGRPTSWSDLISHKKKQHSIFFTRPLPPYLWHNRNFFFTACIGKHLKWFPACVVFFWDHKRELIKFEEPVLSISF